MSDESNDDTVYTVREGDTVIITTEDGTEYQVECIDYSTHHAKDPDIVQETMVWKYEDSNGESFGIQKVEGLKRFPNQADFPHELPFYKPTDTNENEVLGYVVDVNFL